VSVAAVFAGRRIAVIHVALPDTAGPAKELKIITVKPRRAKGLTVCRKIVVENEKNPISQKKWMIKLRAPPFLG
jgi:hypothetical protein